MKDMFRKISTKISNAVGSAGAFMLAFAVVLVWAVTGPMFNFSDTWQLVINTGTTIVTFLMVFLIQNTQNRDSKAQHLKLDELIRVTKTARDSFVSLEELTDSELEVIDNEFKQLNTVKDNPALHKLHSKIAEEKQRRYTLGSAGKAIKSFLQTPIQPLTAQFSSRPSDKKDNKK
jgi:low affinity Fe/Cu permease